MTPINNPGETHVLQVRLVEPASQYIYPSAQYRISIDQSHVWNREVGRYGFRLLRSS